jgi:peptidyl-prolyl cis-trans isomerase A (cyclophilin A)
MGYAMASLVRSHAGCIIKNLAPLCFLAFLITACGTPYPRILMETEMGEITLGIYTHKAPVTATNFLTYVDENRFEGAVFYRIVRSDNQPGDSIRIAVVQGGLFEDNHPAMLPPILHETTRQTGILHKDGVISMARSHPGTATSEFFICLGDQPELDYNGKRNPDKQGFAAFGKVIHGMDVVKAIHQLPAKGQTLDPAVKILSISRLN